MMPCGYYIQFRSHFNDSVIVFYPGKQNKVYSDTVYLKTNESIDATLDHAYFITMPTEMKTFKIVLYNSRDTLSIPLRPIEKLIYIGVFKLKDSLYYIKESVIPMLQ